MRRKRIPQSAPVDPRPVSPVPVESAVADVEPIHAAAEEAVSGELGSAQVPPPLEEGEFESEPRMARRDRFSEGLVARAQLVFGVRLKRDVSPDEARLMLGDLTDFYELAVVRQDRLKREVRST